LVVLPEIFRVCVPGMPVGFPYNSDPGRSQNEEEKGDGGINIDVSVCPRCGGEARVIASIEEQLIPEGTGPPAAQLF
jgi:hypothetical protein